jgi:hypothetical protein
MGSPRTVKEVIAMTESVHLTPVWAGNSRRSETPNRTMALAQTSSVTNHLYILFPLGPKQCQSPHSEIESRGTFLTTINRGQVEK